MLLTSLLSTKLLKNLKPFRERFLCQKTQIKLLLKNLNFYLLFARWLAVVEPVGIEPTTLGLQSRCSTS